MIYVSFLGFIEKKCSPTTLIFIFLFCNFAGLTEGRLLQHSGKRKEITHLTRTFPVQETREGKNAIMGSTYSRLLRLHPVFQR